MTSCFSTNTAEQSEYYFKEGCYILEYHNDSRDPNISIARARLVGGQTTQMHRLVDTSERYLILQGEAEANVNGETFDLKKGSSLFIPEGHTQCITNTGEDDLVFLAICHPRFEIENYRRV